MFKIILVVFVLLIWVLHTYKKKKTLLLPSIFLLLLYFVSVVLSIPHIKVNNETLVLKPEYFEASVVFILLLFLFLYPFTRIREDKIKTIVLPNARLLYSFSVIIVLLSLFSVIYFIPTVINIFSLDNLNLARLQMTGGELFVEQSIFNTIASVSASFYTIAIFLFFIYRAKGTNKKLSILLLVSSLSYVLNVFAYVGRDGVIFWIFSFLGSYALFRDFLPANDKKLIKNVLLVFIGLAIPLFMAITFDRFSDNPFAGVLSYIGQPFPNFCLAYAADYPVSYGAAFPFFREILGMPEAISFSGEYGNTVSWVFGTFLKSFLVNFDLFGTVLISILMAMIIFSAIKKNSKVFYFHQLFLYFLYFQIFSQGVFYFRQYTRGGNLFIILSFFFYFIFLFLRKNHNINSERINRIYNK